MHSYALHQRPPFAGLLMMGGPKGRRHHGWGPPGPPFGGPWGGGRRSRRRGDVRAAVLRLLSEQPMHGYQILQELAERSGGAWRPSPGSVYPTLQQLEDEGLVKPTDLDGRRVFELTAAGRKEAERLATGEAPWDEAAAEDGEGVGQLRDLAMQVGAATLQVAHAGSAAQVAKAAAILTEARKALYRLLADGDET